MEISQNQSGLKGSRIRPLVSEGPNRLKWNLNFMKLYKLFYIPSHLYTLQIWEKSPTFPDFPFLPISTSFFFFLSAE